MAGIFKAYDVRGTYPDQLDESTARAIGLAFRHVLEEDDLACGSTVVVGRDMRASSVPLQRALIDGLCAGGLDVVDVGLVTTPMSYFAVGHLGAAGGIQVTASHNPAAYNGFKLSRHEARPVSGDHGIPLLERLVTEGDLPLAERPGSVRRHDVMPAYGEHLLATLRRPDGARRLRVVVDAANGMGTIYRPLLERAGIELVPLYFELDGTFPNHEANPLKLDNLRDLIAEVKRRGADLGVAFDGDADRAAFVDERGEPVGSDLATALIAGRLLDREGGGVVVYDLRSSRAVAEYVREHGGVPIRERVGHSFIKATLRQHDGLFGGELAGHYYFRANYTADCALMAVFELLGLLWQEDKPLSALVAPLKRYAKSPEINFQVADKEAKIALLAERYADAEIDYLDGITIQYDDWWCNVRPSNTEPYLRLVAEADDDALLQARLEELVGLLGEPIA
ncbi:MAG: phosphomannomutase/phosphoglucomutase [Acidobacteria bacterium]|nr:MAG: phosphomannomutase/phosphoglucomutase [Acidobacteriota bacterium]